MAIMRHKPPPLSRYEQAKAEFEREVDDLAADLMEQNGFDPWDAKTKARSIVSERRAKLGKKGVD